MSRLFYQESFNEGETRQFGAVLGREVFPPGSLILVSGEMGAGKTCFIKGVAQGLGIDPDLVTSPTFALIHEYAGAQGALCHIDLYRLDTDQEVLELGIDELIDHDTVLVVEWGDRFRSLFQPPHYEVIIQWKSTCVREIEVYFHKEP